MSCCPPDASCLECPIIVSCVPGLVLKPGQLQFCPTSGKFTYDVAGQRTCLNPTYGPGLGLGMNCLLQVRLAPERPLVFDTSGNIDIDCMKLITCCQLVTQSQFATAVDLLWNHLNVPYLNCAGQPLAPNSRLKQCADVEVIYGYPAGLFGASGCVLGTVATVDAFGRVVWRSRDDACINSSGIGGAGPAYINFTITNTFSTTALLEVSLQALCLLGDNVVDGNQTVTMLHKVGEVFEVNPYPYGSVQWLADAEGWTWTTFSTNSNAFAAQSGVATGQIFPLYGGGSAQSSVPAQFKKLLAPGESVTLWGQYWAIFSDAVVGDQVNFHAGFEKNSFWKLTRGAALL